jgi:hypothetical protein
LFDRSIGGAERSSGVAITVHLEWEKKEGKQEYSEKRMIEKKD